jgi:hypothetical protein
MVENVLFIKTFVGSPGVSNKYVSNTNVTFLGNKTVSFKVICQ